RCGPAASPAPGWTRRRSSRFRRRAHCGRYPGSSSPRTSRPGPTGSWRISPTSGARTFAASPRARLCWPRSIGPKAIENASQECQVRRWGKMLRSVRRVAEADFEAILCDVGDLAVELTTRAVPHQAIDAKPHLRLTMPSWLTFAVVGLTLATFGLRVFHLTATGLWVDEYLTVWLAGEPLVPLLNRMALSEPNPPFYYLLIKVLFRVLADNDLI